MKQCNQEALDWYNHQQELEEKLLSEERITLLETLLRFLPPVRQKVMAFYYLQGFSVQRITDLLRLPHGRVLYEMHQAHDFLQKATQALAYPRHRKATKTASKPDILPVYTLQEKIYQLRHAHKLSFIHIADKMNHSAVFVHQCYIEAHARLHQLRQTG